MPASVASTQHHALNSDVIAQNTAIPVAPPAGRGLLQWEGKHVPASVQSSSWKISEVYGPPGTSSPLPSPAESCNRLYHGDNQAVLAHLLAEGWGEHFRLIYIDPPFDSGLAYAGKVRTRGPSRRTLGQVVQYRDIWPGDTYLQFIYTRLLLLRSLLAPNGVIWLHCDYRQSHRLQLILEEVFGAENYLNTIAWRSQVARGAKVNAFYFPNSTHFLHVFTKDRQAGPVWNPPRKRLVYTRRQAAAQFMEDEQGFFRTSDPGSYSFTRLQELYAQGRLYAPYGGEVRMDPATQSFYCTNGGNLGVKYYLTREGKNRFSVERAVDNLWDDIPGLGTTPGEEVGYPTQKTEALLERIIAASTDPGDWVLDCFMGSGTTPVVAQRMERRWVACDLGHGAVQTTRRRLFGVLHTQEKCEESIDEASSSPAIALYAPLCAAEKIRGLAQETTATAGVKDVPPGPPLTLTLKKADKGLCLTLAHQPDSTGDTADFPSTGIDWRSWIETVEIDPWYDGSVFCPQLVDAPTKRGALVEGAYVLVHLPADVDAAEDPHAGQRDQTIAVRVTEVSGREIYFSCPVPSSNNHRVDFHPLKG